MKRGLKLGLRIKHAPHFAVEESAPMGETVSGTLFRKVTIV